MRRIIRITRIGMVINASLAVIKLVVGYLSGSLGLVADGFNSLLDIFTDFIVVAGATIGAKPADKNHPYGHGKIETFTSVIVDLALMVLGAGIIWSALVALQQPAKPVIGKWVIIVSAITFVTKNRLYRITKRIADEVRSSALDANSWNHRTDSYLALLVMGGGISSMLGFPQGDKIAGLVLGLFIITVGAKLMYHALFELSEGSPGHETEQQIIDVISSSKDVKGWHKLRIRRIGRELSMDVHILLDQDITVKMGHDIVRAIEKEAERQLDWPVNLTIHIDPASPEIIAARQAVGDPTLRLED
ncbi:cation diffusion facilitator family transporter [Calditrichota bacterium]